MDVRSDSLPTAVARAPQPMKTDYSYHYRKFNSDDPDAISKMIASYHRVLAPHLPPNREAQILDVGCGMGFAMLALKELGYRNVAGIDSDEGQVASCRAKALEVSCCPDSVAFLNDHPGAYGAIVLFDVIEHIPVPEQIRFVRALAAALQPGGVLFCTTPNANSFLIGRYRYLDWTHVTAFTEHSLDFLLHNGGFGSTQIVPLDPFRRPTWWWLPVGGSRHWWAYRFFRFWRRLEMMAELGPQQGRLVPLSQHLMAVAKKG
jgi:2-polyprenyl-3-methyl-5-hydroxy-6-metoxy-1,4-benzoquinol methylase